MENEKKQLTETKPSTNGNNWLVYSLVIGLLLFVVGIAAFLVVSKQEISVPLILMLAIAGIIVALGVIFALRVIKKGGKHEPDYYAFFILGLTWLPLGLALDNPGFWAMGLVFMGIGLANKDKWKKKSWKDISPAQKQLKIALIVFLGLLVSAGLVAYYFVK
jgi:hypothetical protein